MQASILIRLQFVQFNSHIIVDFWSSVKFIKYICKYANKGSDMALFQIHTTDLNAPRLNDNEAIMR